MAEVGQARVGSARAGVRLGYLRPAHQAGRQVGPGDEHGFAVEQVAPVTDDHAFPVGQPEEYRSPGRRIVLAHLDAVDFEGPPLGFGSPDRLAFGPGLAGKAPAAVPVDRADTP